MFTERQFDNYNEAMRDLRNYPPDKRVENILAAFNLGLQRAPAAIKDHLTNANRPTWYSLAAILWDGVTYIIKIQAGAAAIGAVIGGVALSEVPVFGTASGAALGAQLGLTVSSWYLAAIGLGSMAAIAAQVAGSASVDFEEGVRLAKNGSIDAAANAIAKGFAKILEMIAATIILICFVRGGQRVLSKIKTSISANTKLISMLKGLPGPINSGQAYFRSTKWGQEFAKGWGYSYQEVQALMQMSTNGKFYVVRTCNTARTTIGKGVALEGKGLEIKAKSITTGIHKGKAGVDAEDIAKLKTNYVFEELPQNSGYRLKIKPGKQGELNNHMLERADYTTFGNDSGKMVLLDPLGRPHIPDMDRLVCMELNAANGTVTNPTLKDLAKFGDDPAEVEAFNAELNRILGNSKVNIDAAMHGYTASNIKPNGKPIWHADSNEILLLFADGRMFEMAWNQFVLFCEANKAMNLPQCFKLVTP